MAMTMERRKVKTTSDVLAWIREAGVEMVDLRFTDLPGTWQHVTVPAAQLDEKTFERGIGFDGSSIRGFQEINESDMLLLPDPSTAALDPFYAVPTLTMICDVVDPETGKAYSRDARHVAARAERYLRETGIADTSYWGPEIEFFLFDSVHFEDSPHRVGYRIDSREAIWNSANGTNGLRIRPKEGYFPAPPLDSFQDVRSEIAQQLARWGIEVEMHHHEVATAGQAELDMRYDTLVRQGDQVMIYKYLVKNVAHAHGLTATFMPKPLFGDNGSGMHVHQSLWKDGQNLFYSAGGYAELSELALHYIGGLLTHIDSVLAFAAPTTNSYKRLVPGYEAPVNVVFSKRNRSAAIRIPMYYSGPAMAAAKRIEFRPPDPSANPYLAFAAMLMAGLDGIERRIDPVAAGFGPLDKNVYSLSEVEKAGIRKIAGSLDDTLAALERDHDYLLKGGVFTEDLIQTWISYKREREIQPVRIRPHPYEFYLYADV